MHNIISRAIVAVAALAASVSMAAAAPSVDKRQDIQAKRIEDGRKTGAITWREGLKLRQEQARIARLEARYRADGKLDRHEARHLKELQDKASRNIYRERHDRWTRWSVLPRVGR